MVGSQAAHPPGGWAFEFDNDGYPDVDDTAEALLALHRVAHPDPAAVAEATRRGVVWLEGMQGRDGGWAAFDADNTREVITKLPFCDFGAVIDPPSADVTAHVVEALSIVDGPDLPAVQRGVGWLLAHQEPDGSWFGRWGVNHVYGTGAVVPALVAAGLRPNHPAVHRATVWLADHQNRDGSWDEDLYTGTGFPGDFSINYHLYRLVFPLSALGRARGTRAGGAPDIGIPDETEGDP